MALRTPLLTIAMTLLVAGCGGGGGGGDRAAAVLPADNGPAASAPAKGGIKVVFGDGPVDGFDQVLMEVEEVRLLSDAGQDVLLVDQPRIIDLLQLRNVTELVIDEDVDAGTYSKIRLLVRSITLVRLDDDGGVQEEIAARLVANGKVDLNPRGDIEITAGEDLVVEVDVDLDRSVHIHANGKGEYRFRPVVFVRVIDQDDDARLIRLFGQMDNIDAEAETLDLCNVELLSGRNELPEDRCLPIVLKTALLVGEDGRPIAMENLIDGDYATVLARFRYGVEADDSVYQAVLLAVGEEGTFEQLFGDVVTAVDEGAFDIRPDDSDVDVEVRLVDGALVLDDDNTEVGPLAIQPGQEAELWGLFVAENDEEFFRAFLVHLDDDDDHHSSVAGRLLRIDLEADKLWLEDADGNEACVQLGEDTTYYQLNGDDERVEGGEIVVGDLALGQDTFIEAFGGIEDGCLNADEVVIETTSDDPD